MSSSHLTYLSEDSLAALGITAADIIKILQELIHGVAAGTVHAAPKAVLTPPDGRYIMSTLAAMDDPPLVATKSLVLNKENSNIDLPQINGIVTLLDGATGLPVAVLDCNWITGIRTAGLSALAAHYMANPDARTVGFVGTGLQARSHLQLYADMFPLKHVKISGRGQANIDRLAEHASDLGLTTEICDTPRDAVEGCDLVVTSVTHTGIDGPFLDADWLAPGTFLSSVDLGAPWHRDSFQSLDRLVIDDVAQEATLPQKLANPKDVDGDLAQLVAGTIAGRSEKSDRTAFVFRGMALGDLALAALAYQKHVL